jgi:phosphoserine phosphatase
MRSKNGTFTGEIQGATMLGEGKARAALKFMAEKGARPENCFAYGDHITDLEMLNAVGNPRVVSGDPELESVARERNWPVINGAVLS